MTKIEHLGIAVTDLNTSIPLFEKLLNTACYKRESVAREGVETAFFATGPNKIELLQATQPDSPIAKFLQKQGPGLHHVAFAVDDIQAEMKRLSAQGIRLLSDEPKPGADHKLICFLHPKDTGGMLIELCQDREPNEDHTSPK